MAEINLYGDGLRKRIYLSPGNRVIVRAEFTEFRIDKKLPQGKIRIFNLYDGNDMMGLESGYFDTHAADLWGDMFMNTGKYQLLYSRSQVGTEFVRMNKYVNRIVIDWGPDDPRNSGTLSWVPWTRNQPYTRAWKSRFADPRLLYIKNMP